MAKYRKRPVVIEATQWFKMGDHPGVTFYLNANTIMGPDENPCEICKKGMAQHGRVPTLEGFHIVCPGDWVITGIKGENYPCKADIFEATYEAVMEDNK